MIAAQEPETRRNRLQRLLEWLERMPKSEVRVRIYCPDHPDTLMVTRKTENGVSHLYCPEPGCQQKWKGNPVRQV